MPSPCPRCGTSYNIKPENSGASFKCRQCNTELSVLTDTSLREKQQTSPSVWNPERPFGFLLMAGGALGCAAAFGARTDMASQLLIGIVSSSAAVVGAILYAMRR